MLRDIRNLPDPVITRLSRAFGDDTMAEPLPGFDQIITHRGQKRRVEERANRLELRQTDDGAPIIDGYATVYDTWYDVLGGPPYGWSEMFAVGSTSKSISEQDDVRFLVNHEGVPLARTSSGTLRLESDTTGLFVTTPQGVDVRSPDVQGLVVAMERGDIDQMSLAFRATRQEWNDDYTERTIREVQLFDVSVVTYPANPATLAGLRAVFEAGQEPAKAGMSLDLARAIVDSVRR